MNDFHALVVSFLPCICISVRNFVSLFLCALFIPNTRRTKEEEMSEQDSSNSFSLSFVQMSMVILP